MQTTISGLVLIPLFLLTVFYIMKYKVKDTLTIYKKNHCCIVHFLLLCSYLSDIFPIPNSNRDIRKSNVMEEPH